MTDESSSDYVAWKGWVDGGSFATLGPGDAQYFSAELREARRNRALHDVLEIGYGNGTFLRFCADNGWHVVGTELLPELVAAGTAAGFDARDADDVADLPDGGFDLVVAFDVFEHIDPEQSIEFLSTLRDKLRPGGSIVLRFPNADSWIGNPFQNGDPTHVNAIGLLKMRYYATATGLEMQAFRGISRRGFSTSLVHGIHRMTGDVVARLVAGLARAVFLPALPVVLSTGNVICVLRRATA